MILAWISVVSFGILLQTNIILKIKFDEGITFHQFGVPSGRIENFGFKLNAINLIFGASLVIGVIGSSVLWIKMICDSWKMEQLDGPESEAIKTKPAKEDTIPWWESL